MINTHETVIICLLTIEKIMKDERHKDETGIMIVCFVVNAHKYQTHPNKDHNYPINVVCDELLWKLHPPLIDMI